MVIDEQDIFKYVFYREKLNADKLTQIEKDKTLVEIIGFYRELKINASKEITNDIRKKIAEKIPAYSTNSVIELRKSTIELKPNNNGRRLAADSETVELVLQAISSTFTDDDNSYLIRVLNYENKTKIYVFCFEPEIINNFDIIIKPQNLRYHLKDNSEPLLIAEPIEIESIRLNLFD